MSIVNIDEVENPVKSTVKPVKEKMDKFIPGIINLNIATRNGFISIYCGAGGTGKTSLALSSFLDKNKYFQKFDTIYYFCPEGSFLSVVNHPFKDLPNVKHELTVQNLEEIYKHLEGIKISNEEKAKKKKQKMLDKKSKNKKILGYTDIEDSDDSDNEDLDDSNKYHVIFIDDFADSLKDIDIQRQLNKMMIKARHICCAFIFTLQSYLYFPKMLRKQITNATIFLPTNNEETESIAGELCGMQMKDAQILFDYVFQEEYDHLDIDTRKSKYYRNFNELKLEFKNKIEKPKKKST